MSQKILSNIAETAREFGTLEFGLKVFYTKKAKNLTGTCVGKVMYLIIRFPTSRAVMPDIGFQCEKMESLK